MYRSPPDLDRAEAVQRQALELVPAELDSTFNAFFRAGLGTIELFRGHGEAALAIAESVVADAVDTGDRFVEAVLLTNAGWARLALGDPRPELFGRALELALQLGVRGWHRVRTGGDGRVRGPARRPRSCRDAPRCGGGGADPHRHGRSAGTDHHAPYVQMILASEGAGRFDAARARGRAMSRSDALSLALA